MYCDWTSRKADNGPSPGPNRANFQSGDMGPKNGFCCCCCIKKSVFGPVVYRCLCLGSAVVVVGPNVWAGELPEGSHETQMYGSWKSRKAVMSRKCMVVGASGRRS